MRILSGVQPSGRLHLGNYFGAIEQFLALQDQGEALYFIADLHALTTLRNAEELKLRSFDLALDFLALGLDPERCILFKQSEILEITQLTWILSALTPMGLLERAHSYKDKTAKGLDADVGLFTYPVLMAADILAYGSELVPVGKDQKQHLEITRDLAVKFNQSFCPDFNPETGEGGVLKLPQGHILEEKALVPGNDGQKMSKSYGNTIDIFAPEKEVKKSIMRVVTDSTPLEAPKDFKTCNVFALLSFFTDQKEQKEIKALYQKGGKGYGDFKKLLFEKVLETFGPARQKRKELSQDHSYVLKVLQNGAERARKLASQTLQAVQQACGLRP